MKLTSQLYVCVSQPIQVKNKFPHVAIAKNED